MPQLSDPEIDSILGIKKTPESVAASNLASQATAVSPVPQIGSPPVRRAAETWQQRNAKSVPLDMDREADLPVKIGVLMRDNPEDKVSYLESVFGVGNARLSDDGRPIATVFDADRQSPVEISVLGESSNMSDLFANVAAMAPETLGAIAGDITGGKASANRFLKYSARMIGAAAGQEAAGAAKDAAVSSDSLGNIIKERAGRVSMDTVLNVGMDRAGKVLGRVVTPFRGAKGAIESNLDDAAGYFAEKYGVEYPRTLGETTGSSVIKRIEAAMSKNPGSSKAFDDFQMKKLNAFREIQQKMMSSKLDPSDFGMLKKLAEDVGEEGISLLKSKINPVTEAAALAKNNAARTANTEIMDELAQATGPARELYPERVVSELRTEAFSKRDAFQADMSNRYEELYKLPGGTDKILQPPNLIADAKKLLKEQPAPKETTQQATAIVGPTGQPLTQTVSGEKMLREFIPSEAVSKLSSLASLKNPEFSLRDLVRMRTEVRNDIAKGQAIPNVSTHYLGEIEKLLGRAIEEGADTLPDKTLKNQWKATNEAYRKGVEGFKDNNIARLFKDVESGGFVQNEDIFRGLGSTEYESFKKFFGETSPQFTKLKRAVLDNIVESASPIGSETMDAGRFLSGLDSFVTGKRAMAEDILGADRIDRLSRLSKLAKIYDGENINQSELTKLIASAPSNVADEFKAAVANQRELDKVFKSKLLKDISEGNISEFDGKQFVDRLYSQTGVRETEQIVGMLASDPTKLEQLRRKTVERILHEAQREVRPGDSARLGQGELFRQTNTSSLERVIGSEDNKAKLKVILGDDAMQDFEQLAKLLRGGEVAEKAFKGASTFAAAEQVNSMLRGGVLSYLGDFMKQKIGALVYSNPAFRGMIGNTVMSSPEAQLKLSRAMVASQPFVSAITEDFGENGARAALDYITNSIDRFEEEGPKGSPALRKQDWVDEILSTNRNQKVFPAPR